MPTSSGADQKARAMAAFANAVFEQRQALYQRTGNPFHVWHAFVSARRMRVSTPPWVLQYFDEVAEALTVAQGSRSPQAIAEALSLATRGGPSKARQAEIDERALDIVGRIWALQNVPKAHRQVDLGIHDHLGILQRVAEEYKLSVDRVRALYRQVIRSGAERGREKTSAKISRLRRRTSAKPLAKRQTRARRSQRTNSGSS